MLSAHDIESLERSIVAAAVTAAIQGPRLEVVFMNRSEITGLRSLRARVTRDYDRIRQRNDICHDRGLFEEEATR